MSTEETVGNNAIFEEYVLLNADVFEDMMNNGVQVGEGNNMTGDMGEDGDNTTQHGGASGKSDADNKDEKEKDKEKIRKIVSDTTMLAARKQMDIIKWINSVLEIVEDGKVTNAQLKKKTGYTIVQLMSYRRQIVQRYGNSLMSMMVPSTIVQHQKKMEQYLQQLLQKEHNNASSTGVKEKKNWQEETVNPIPTPPVVKQKQFDEYTDWNRKNNSIFDREGIRGDYMDRIFKHYEEGKFKSIRDFDDLMEMLKGMHTYTTFELQYLQSKYDRLEEKKNAPKSNWNEDKQQSDWKSYLFGTGQRGLGMKIKRVPKKEGRIRKLPRAKSKKRYIQPMFTRQWKPY